MSDVPRDLTRVVLTTNETRKCYKFYFKVKNRYIAQNDKLKQPVNGYV